MSLCSLQKPSMFGWPSAVRGGLHGAAVWANARGVRTNDTATSTTLNPRKRFTRRAPERREGLVGIVLRDQGAGNRDQEIRDRGGRGLGEKSPCSLAPF